MIPFNSDIDIAGFFYISKQEDNYTLLPDGHAAYYPLTFNSNAKRKVIKGELNFYNKIAFENYKPDLHLPQDKCDLMQSKSANQKLLIYNALDNCFGHSLLKLFYFVSELEEKSIDFDFILLLPKALSHFLKPFKGLHVLSVDLPFKDFEKCLVLNNFISPVIKEYKETLIFPSSTYKLVSHSILKKMLNLTAEVLKETNKAIVYYYRKDANRSWSSNKQAANVIKLFSKLKPFFSNIDFIVLGDIDKKKFPEFIIDKRISNFDAKSDFEINSILARSLITIGFTGSHMLFPSILSKQTVHLIPTFKLKNIGEDIVFENTTFNMHQYYKHMFYAGNYDVDVIKPDNLFVYILNGFAGLLEKEFRYTEINQSLPEWVKVNYPNFEYEKFYAERSNFAIGAYKKSRWRILFNKFIYG